MARIKTKIGLLPDTWNVSIIGDHVINYRGGASLKPSDFTDSGIKVLPKVGVIPGGKMHVDNDKQKYCSPEYAKTHSKSVVDKSFLIVVLRDLVPSGPSIGLIVRIISNEEYVLAQGVYGLKINESAIIPNFLIYLSNSTWYRKYMQKILVGSTQVHIRTPEFLKVQIPLPPLPEQKKIAEILSTVDEQIATTDAIIRETRELKRGLMQRLFTRGIGHTKFKKTKIGEVPEEWEVRKFENCDISLIDGDRGVNYPSQNELLEKGYCLFLNTGNIVYNRFLFSSCQFISEEKDNLLNKGKLQRGDIVLTTRRKCRKCCLLLK
jgi:type I restriction enzyme S subunit